MKNIIRLIVLTAIAAFALTACEKENNSVEQGVATTHTLNINVSSSQSDTKAAFGELTEDNKYPAYWEKGDVLPLYVNSSKLIDLTIPSDGDAAHFAEDVKITETQDGYTFYSIYPATEISAGTATVNIPTEPATGATVVMNLAAKTKKFEQVPTDIDLTYIHVNAYAKVNIKNLENEGSDVISSVTIKSTEDISGTFTYSFADGKLSASEAFKTLSLNTSALEGNFFACAPQTEAAEWIVTVTSTGGKTWTKKFTLGKALRAGLVAGMNIDFAGIKATTGTEENTKIYVRGAGFTVNGKAVNWGLAGEPAVDDLCFPVVDGFVTLDFVMNSIDAATEIYISTAPGDSFDANQIMPASMSNLNVLQDVVRNTEKTAIPFSVENAPGFMNWTLEFSVDLSQVKVIRGAYEALYISGWGMKINNADIKWTPADNAPVTPENGWFTINITDWSGQLGILLKNEEGYGLSYDESVVVARSECPYVSLNHFNETLKPSFDKSNVYVYPPYSGSFTVRIKDDLSEMIYSVAEPREVYIKGVYKNEYGNDEYPSYKMTTTDGITYTCVIDGEKNKIPEGSEVWIEHSERGWKGVAGFKFGEHQTWIQSGENVVIPEEFVGTITVVMTCVPTTQPGDMGGYWNTGCDVIFEPAKQS
ncbi:hypothetical protein F070042J6_46200 [Bacteroides sp. f07]|uniref:hypothetical protein n=1 Tax=Bacteroides sp. f07 TaxID=3132704 RepID=UPI0034AD32BB